MPPRKLAITPLTAAVAAFAQPPQALTDEPGRDG